MISLNNYITSISHWKKLVFSCCIVLFCSFLFSSDVVSQDLEKTDLATIGYVNLGNYQKKSLERHLAISAKAALKTVDSSLLKVPKTYNRNTYLLSDANKKRTLILTSALLVSSFAFDIYTRDAAMKQRYTSFDRYFDRTNTVGEYQVVLKTIGSTMALGLVLRNKKLQQTSLNTIRSVLVTKPISDLSKRVFGRARPRLEKGNLSFYPSRSGAETTYRSYISGHTSTAWALVTPYAEAYSRWLYVLPLSTAVARLYLDRHWVSDVVAGGVVGFFAGYTAHHGSKYNIRLTGNGLIFQF